MTMFVTLEDGALAAIPKDNILFAKQGPPTLAILVLLSGEELAVKESLTVIAQQLEQDTPKHWMDKLGDLMGRGLRA